MTESLSTFAITSTLPKEYKKPSATKTLSASPLSIKKYEGLSVEPRSPSLTREVVEYEGGEDGDTEAITKEEEWITKKKTELTTTRQIETRVKRNVVLEDGKVIEDSGPIVSTNTTEDTDKQETETTERKDIGGTDENDQIPAIQFGGTGNDLVSAGSALGTALANFGGKPVTKLVPRPVDGLVRETNEKRVVSREEIKERVEVEDVAHLGDFSDEAYLRAVNSGAENLEEVLYSPENQKQLIPLGPQIVHQSIKGRKVVDTEDVQKRCLAQDDGTLVTEQKKTTEHEEFYDQDLPEKDDHSTGSQEQIQTTESSQRYFKQRDEQNVDYVADGKLVGQEMRYAAETEQMERDGPPERPEDWDSLSDRIRKSRLKPKTLLQQQKEAILGDRKDALTKRPLDFDREEETRKGETMKWLESHFGSESTTSSDSRENDDVEPTKKSYFNVTIKSNQNGNTSTLSRPSPAKAVVPQEPLPSPIATKPQTQQLSQNGKTKYFQGISNWADRRESTPKQLVSKAFKDELSGTLERNKNLRQISSSRDDLRYAARNNKATDTYVSKEDIMQQKRSHYNNFGSRTDLRYRRQSRDDSGDELKKEDLGYLSGSRTDLRRDRRDSNEEGGTRKAHNLKREDSGYVKDSREDVRSSLLREEESNSKISNGGKSIIQRDDSAYISSSTNFTEPNQRLPKTSPARASSPEFQGRPSVPQRRRVIEKKLRQTNSNYSPPSPIRNIDRSEPPPDYSPPPRSSRSRSPPAIIIPPAPAPPINGTLPSTARKSNQRTRFASESSSKPTASTQTQTTPPKSGSKVGQAIGNSIRKLVGKIRSASADRKFRMKSKSKSRDRSPSPSNNGNNSIHSNGPNSTTYQQYNVIDSHISGGSNSHHHQPQQPTSVLKSSKSAPLNRESSIISSSMTNGRGADRRGSSDLDIMANGGANPKQRYYLGEDPYGGSIFGKENKYDKNGKLQRRREGSSDEMPVNNNHRETYVRQQPNLSSSNTLGRYQKSYNTSTSNYYNSRLGSTPNLGADYDYRSAQTLPRKLDHSNQNGNNYFQNRPPQHHSSTINVSFVNQVKSQPLQNTGPAKPARMYSSKPQLNRSKSFNVHGLNGTNDPNPIFIGKSRNHYNRGETMYKSNPALYHASSQQQDTFVNGLKSPSIVNLISRSQKDLTRIGEDEPPVDFRKEKRMSHMNKKDVFLKGLQDQAPELYRTIHGGSASPVVNGRHYKHPSSSLGSRSPIEINKDTASIIRRGSSSTETDYTETYKYTTKNDDPKRPTVTNTVQSFTKKTVPTKDGRGLETIHSQEKKSVTTSRFKNEPISNLKYYDDRRRRSGSSNLGGGTTVIEVRRK